MTEINRLQDTVRSLQSQRAAGMPASDESKQMQEALSGLQAHYNTYKEQREGEEFGVNVTPELLSYLENYARDALNEAKSVASSMEDTAESLTDKESFDQSLGEIQRFIGESEKRSLTEGDLDIIREHWDNLLKLNETAPPQQQALALAAMTSLPSIIERNVTDATPATASRSSETSSQDGRAKAPSDDSTDLVRPLPPTPSQSPLVRGESRRPLTARRTELMRPFESTMNQQANALLSPPPSRQGSSSNPKAGEERRGSVGSLQDKNTRRPSAFGGAGKSARKFIGKLAPSGWSKKADSKPTLDLVVQNAQWESDEIATWASSQAEPEKGNVANSASRPFAELRKRNENAPSQGWTKARIAAWAAEPKDIPIDSRPATPVAHDQSNSAQEQPAETVLAAPLPIHPNLEAPALASMEESIRTTQQQDDASASVASSSAERTNSEDVDRAAEEAWALDENDLTPFDQSAYAQQASQKAN